MNLSVNGESKVPPGFRFHPTEEELLQYYLKKRVASENIDLDVIRDIDLNKLEPWDIQEMCQIGTSTPQNDWYFFSHKDKKYPSGTRTNRATAAGFWKATGRDKAIYSNCSRIGMRKTLVFYRGRAPHGQKSDWIMHEYRLIDDNHSVTTHDSHHSVSFRGDGLYNSNNNNISSCPEASEEAGGWVVCRVFWKKNYQKVTESPKKRSSPPSGPSTDSRSDQMHTSPPPSITNQEEVLLPSEHHMLSYMDSNKKLVSTNSFKRENNEVASTSTSMNSMTTNRTATSSMINMTRSCLAPNINHINIGDIVDVLDESFLHPDLPPLDSPLNSPLFEYPYYQSIDEMLKLGGTRNTAPTAADTAAAKEEDSVAAANLSWVALDRLVASQLNCGHLDVPAEPGEESSCKQLSCLISGPHRHHHHHTSNDDITSSMSSSFCLSPD